MTRSTAFRPRKIWASKRRFDRSSSTATAGRNTIGSALRSANLYVLAQARAYRGRADRLECCFGPLPNRIAVWRTGSSRQTRTGPGRVDHRIFNTETTKVHGGARRIAVWPPGDTVCNAGALRARRNHEVGRHCLEFGCGAGLPMLVQAVPGSVNKGRLHSITPMRNPPTVTKG